MKFYTKPIIPYRKAILQLCLFAFLMFTSIEFVYAQENKLFNPAAAKPQLGLPQTKVMVLGISHLDAASGKFQVAWLEPLLCRLRAYNPQVILTEALPGEQVMGLDAYAAYHGDAGKYAGPTLEMAKTAQTELCMSAAQALVKADSLAQKKELNPIQRRYLAALFVAAAEPFSATVQWMRLGTADRIAQDGISPSLVKRLNRFAELRSELSSIAARLAADIRLERVYGAGDHASDVVLPDHTDMQNAVNAEPGLKDLFNHNTAAFHAMPEDTMKLGSASQVMPVLKWKNSSRFAELDADAQWFSMLRSVRMGRVGRQRVAAWEAQNLQMAVAIREATAPIAGGRALLVVGAAHKPFIEAYLRMFTDIEVVSVPDLLDSVPAGCSY
ncbi:DUF5694 domain-containing protein [Chryseobacterium sp. JJR-5R]|uniref:DUF5694 domain-containing protein n=1 Tax=Chryseobacterium sp. JJR-5R TaxID=3093923 RepID=UPI002A75A4BC|nr:DUF5694 domain-containing protein [Chryseobacterium sp. JJR-5R]WPO81938.1 DUF5694 domain-containing protein [Chryseobacterium sp. JJR-5R]